MTFGTEVNKEQLKLIEDSGIEFDYYDFEDLMNDEESYQLKNNKIGVEFDSIEEFEKVSKLLGRC